MLFLSVNVSVASFTVAENGNNLNVHQKLGGSTSGSPLEVVLLSKEHLVMSGEIVCHNGKMKCFGIHWFMTRDAAKHPLVQRPQWQ